MNNTRNTTFLNFFRINRLLSYVVLSMVLPSIAWPAAGHGDGGRYDDSQTGRVHGSGVGLELVVSPSRPLSSQPGPEQRASFASRPSRTQGSRFDVLNPLGRRHDTPAAGANPLTVTRTTNPLYASRAVVASALPLGDSSASNAGVTMVDMPATPANPRNKTGPGGDSEDSDHSSDHASDGSTATPPEKVTLNALHQAAGGSEEPEDKPLTPEELAALKHFNDDMLQRFNMKTTWRDVAQYVTTFLLTGALGMELWGEYQMTIDRTFNSLLATSPELAKAILYDPATRWIKPLFAQYFLINVVVALVPYLPFRLYQFVRTITPGVENVFKRTTAFIKPHCPAQVQAYMPTYGPEDLKSFSKPMSWWPQGLGYLFVLLGAAAIGMGPAYESYESNAPWASSEGAKTIFYTNTIPVFIFIFYALDAMLRLENLKTKGFNRIFVSRKDPVATERAELNEDLRNAKQAILEQQSTALTATLNKMAALNQQSASRDVTAAEGIEQFKILRGLGKARGLSKMRAADEGPKRRSVRSYLRQYGPHALAAILSMPIAYLAGRSTYEGIGGTLEYLATGQPGTTLFDQVTINNAIVDVQYQEEQIPLWNAAINNDTIVFNGLGHGGGDWCSQCLGPPEWGNYLLVWSYPPNPKRTLVNFNHCPGVITTGNLIVNIERDLPYTDATCQSMFYDNQEAWVQTANEYMAFIDSADPHLNPANNIPTYTSPPGADVGAGIGAALSALAQYGMSVLACKSFFERWINSYRKHPTEVLPGKRNTYLTTVVMSWALIQSFVRSAPVLISGLRLLYNDHMDPALRWIILGAATTTSMATYFPEFDEVYSRIPKWVANDVPGALLNLYNIGKKKLRTALGWPETEDFTFNLFRKPVGHLIFPQRDEAFERIDGLRLKLAGEDPEVIRRLHNAGWQFPSSEMRTGIR